MERGAAASPGELSWFLDLGTPLEHFLSPQGMVVALCLPELQENSGSALRHGVGLAALS